MCHHNDATIGASTSTANAQVRLRLETPEVLSRPRILHLFLFFSEGYDKKCCTELVSSLHISTASALASR